MVVATASGGDGILGHGGEERSEGKGGPESEGEVRGGREGGVALVEASRSGGSRRWPRAWTRAATTHPASLWRPSGARWETVAALVGWASSWAVVGRQVCPGEGPSGLLSLSLT